MVFNIRPLPSGLKTYKLVIITGKIKDNLTALSLHYPVTIISSHHIADL